MSGIGKIVGIIACVAAIISAYEDGREVVTRIRERRRNKQACLPPSQNLDISLTEAAHDIESEKVRGVTRLGTRFERGDAEALLQLRQIRIELQAQLFEQLAAALQDDQMIDFGPALYASDLGRDQTVTALMQLRQRLVIAAPIQMPISPPLPYIERTFSMPPIPSAVRQETIVSPPATHALTSHQRAISIPTTTKGSRRRTSNSESGVSYFPSYREVLRFKKTKDDQRIEDSPRESQYEPVEGPSVYSIPPALRHSDKSSMEASPDTLSPFHRALYSVEDQTLIWGDQTAATASAQWTNAMTGSSPGHELHMQPSASNQPQSSSVQVPGADNAYLGFYKGAWKLQCGAEDAVKKKVEFNNGWSSSEVHYLACGSSRCVFAYRLPLDQLDKIWHSGKGISFRWHFLAKSHVEQDRVSNERYAYQCMFCMFMGQKSAVFHGVDVLMQHVAAEHRGRLLAPEVLHRTRCITDRLAADDEDFDINLRPLSKGSAQPRDVFELEGDSNPWR
ncbi:hypothetical protein AAFC00_005602 [Neodothiora populina]|uniref:Uncharacterized protein n=1 Tax=Neodothiora populina TaxID=2781224 RepID=A0ABR3PLL1_9PEZI